MRKTKSPKIKMVSKALAERIDKQCKQYKAERDTLIDDIAVLRANNKRLEREKERLKERNYQLLKINDRLYLDNYKLEQVNKLYNALTQHIRQKAEANPNVDRYIALVNYIDRLEGEEDE
ncbi:hypothetical protein [Staphylococcus gallinarum]|uniref:hypothetical protein n=1 Tax=Staphylococcus gallinarum TaxID=1293 RepID=UPI001E625A71|nr:hypothetical protein [Staphylococcus gallinarum]UEH02035.1 hypothetical protein K3U27_06710 [Staphylococcus gallinarum]